MAKKAANKKDDGPSSVDRADVPEKCIAKRPVRNYSTRHAKTRKVRAESTEAWMQVVIETLKTKPKLAVAARAAGVHPSTVKEARAVHADFNQACLDSIEEFKATTLVDVQNKAIQLAKDGSERMIEFVLKRFDPRYDRKSSVRIGGEEGGDSIQVETETEKTISVIRVTLVNNREEAEEFKRRQAAKEIASQQTIEEPNGHVNGNGHGNGNGVNGKHNGNGNGKK